MQLSKIHMSEYDLSNMDASQKTEPRGREQAAKVLRERLESLGQNQKWLAQRAGIAESTLSDILNSKQDISFDVAKRIEKATEMSISAKTLLNIAAGVDLSEDERLISEMGILGALFKRLSPSRQQDVKDYIALLYRRENTHTGPKDRSVTDGSASSTQTPKSKK